MAVKKPPVKKSPAKKAPAKKIATAKPRANSAIVDEVSLPAKSVIRVANPQTGKQANIPLSAEALDSLFKWLGKDPEVSAATTSIAPVAADNGMKVKTRDSVVANKLKTLADLGSNLSYSTNALGSAVAALVGEPPITFSPFTFTAPEDALVGRMQDLIEYFGAIAEIQQKLTERLLFLL